MARKTKEQKLAEVIVDTLNDHSLNVSVLATCILTEGSTYTEDKLMKLISYVIKGMNANFIPEWNGGKTSEGLLLANALNDTLEQLGK
jgi:hypothetical protein